MRPAHRGTELAARLGTRSARRVRFPKGREPPQGAATKPFGVRSLTTGVKEAVCGSAAYRRRVKRRLRLLGRECGRCSRPMPRQLENRKYTGILLAGCSLVSRAGASKSPTSPTYQQQTAKMKKKENILRFLLLLFLARRMFALEIRHGDVVAFQLVGVPVNLFNLASGHSRRRGASMFFRRRVHYGLICGPRDFRRSEGRAMMFCQYRFAPGI